MIKRICAVTWVGLFCFMAAASAQDTSWVIQGRVVDSLSGEPLAGALVYATAAGTGAFLAHANTDDQGRFELSAPPGERKVWLEASHLGHHSYRARQSYVNRGVPIVIRLRPRDYQLQEVVVAEERPAIVEKSDTTVYDLKQFAEASDYSVEDILRKLPGVEVKPNGSISVGGKPINKVLVEGTDLFGRKYTMGTKNIRAEFIAQVQVIDHYQENPVLKNVNLSDAVVLNLLMAEDKKNILSGTFNGGLGVGLGAELKGALHANLFSISKRRKLILLSDNGNTGESYGRSELEATYGSLNPNDIKTRLHEPPYLQQLPSIANPGLPAPFVDATARGFGTLRAHQQLGSTWELNANALLAFESGRQFQSTEQRFFLDESSYALSTNSRLGISSLLGGADASVRHVNERQSLSFQAHLQWEGGRKEGRQDIEETRGEDVLEYFSDGAARQRDWQLGALLTHQAGERSVFQWQVKAAQVSRPQSLLAENEDFDQLTNTDLEGLPLLSQSLRYHHRELEATGRYRWSNDRTTMELAPVYATAVSSFANQAWLSDGGAAEVPAFDPGAHSDEVATQSAGMRVRLRHALAARLSLRISAEAQQRWYRQASGASFGRFAPSMHVGLHRQMGKGAEGHLAYRYSSNTPPGTAYFTSPFFSDSYTINRQGIGRALEKGHSLTLRYRRRQEFKYRDYHIRLRYQFGQQAWRPASDFFGSLLLSLPFLSGSNQRLVLSGRFSQFVPALKTDLSAGTTLSVGQNEEQAGGQFFSLSHRLAQVNVRASVAVSPAFRLTAESRGGTQLILQEGTGGTGGQDRNKVRNLRSAFTAMYQAAGWRCSATFNHTVAKSPGNPAATLSGLRANCTRELNWRNHPLSIELSLVNLLDVRNLSTVSNNSYFFFRRSVEAVPAFFILRVDYSL